MLEALRDSRTTAKDDGAAQDGNGARTTLPRAGSSSSVKEQQQQGWIGQGTIPAVNYPDLARPGPPLPKRPSLPKVPSTNDRSQSAQGYPRNTAYSNAIPLSPNPPPALPKPSRTPSPNKGGRMKMTLRSGKDGKKAKSKESESRRPQAASKAAGLAWDSVSRASGQGLGLNLQNSQSTMSVNQTNTGEELQLRRASEDSPVSGGYGRPPSPPVHYSPNTSTNAVYADLLSTLRRDIPAGNSSSNSRNSQEIPSLGLARISPPGPTNKAPPSAPYQKPPTDFLSYRNEYPTPVPVSQASITSAVVRPKAYDAPPVPAVSQPRSPQRKPQPPPPPAVHRRLVAKNSTPKTPRPERHRNRASTSSESADETTSSREAGKAPNRAARKKHAEKPSTPSSSGRDSPEGSLNSQRWEDRLAYIKKNLPKGVDPHAAKQIFNEIVVQGDEVHWNDVAGLDAAKSALKEAVVYPFLRPDLFMGLREPARGMLLFGPPGTGKTMLARAVATESHSTFFAISASSLTSKWLGESEKLVRALFALARALAPSIIFVDEIDSLLSSRGGSSEHESTRRIKTEFLIQWSDLQRAAAGKEQSDKDKKQGDPSRVLVLAATNMPWAIDEAARRRFVRRQYIPLPEAPVRAEQLRTLLGHQKHDLSKKDIQVLVELTDGES